MTGLRRRLLWLLLGGCLTSLSLPGQTLEWVAFAGTVLDEQGQPLAGATITFQGLDVSVQREVVTDKQGRFFHGGFTPGPYRVTVRREGQVLWSSLVTLPLSARELQLNIDLKKLREAAERRQRLDPELERLREAERQRREEEDRLQQHYNRGVRHLNEGQPDAAIEAFRAALELEPNRGSTHSLLAAAYTAAGRSPDALAAYHRALELEPDEAAHHNNLGTLLARSGQLEEALAHFERAARLDPARAATYRFNIGAALLNAGRPQDAIPALRESTRLDPTFAAGHYFLGVGLFRTAPRRPTAEATDRIEPRPGTSEAFQRYLQLEPDGPYADGARDFLRQLGIVPAETTVPPVSPAEKRE